MNKKIKKYLIPGISALALMTALFSCRGLFFNPSACYEENIRLTPYDAVIVPGVPFEDSTWSYTMKGRVLWSLYLFRNGITKNIIYSGAAVYTPYTEGKIMALYAEQLGVPKENIFIEDKAEHSTENVYYGCLVAIQNGFKKIALSTDRFQSKTLADFLPKIKRKMHIDIRSLPMQDSLMATIPHEDPVINFSLAKVDSFVSIVDRESRLQRLWGTLGKNIRYDENLYPRPGKQKVRPTN